MSKTANTDDGTDNEDAAAGDQLDQDSSLQELVEARRRQLAQIEAEGEQIKRVVGELVVGNEPHSEVTDEVHQILVGTLGQLAEEEEVVGLPEIVYALWLELDRATGMLAEAAEQAQDDDSDTEGSQDDEDGAGSGEAPLTGDTELAGPAEEEASDDDADDPMATSARMFQ